MKEYYWMHKTTDNIIPESQLTNDADERGYNDITDPCSPDYGNYNKYYTRTKIAV